MERLIDSLTTRLRESGVQLRVMQPVSSIEYLRDEHAWQVHAKNETLQADAVILALPAHASAELVRDIDSHAATLMSSIRYSSVAMVRMSYARDKVHHPLDGSGFVVPAVENTMMTACSWASSKWQRLANPNRVLLRVSVGRFGDDSALELEDNVLAKTLHEELRGPLSISEAPLSFDVVRWHNAFAQYEPGHGRRTELLRRYLAAIPGLHIAGASYDGIGIPACIKSGRNAAEEAQRQLG